MEGDPIIAASARKHGVGDDDMLDAYSHPILVEDLDEGLLMFVRPNRAGNLLEVGFVATADGPVIVRAIQARPKYLR